MKSKAWRCRVIGREPLRQAHLTLLALAATPLDALFLKLQTMDEVFGRLRKIYS